MKRLLTLCLSLAFTASCNLQSDGLERLEELYPTPKPTPPKPPDAPDDLGVQACNALGGNWAVRLVQPSTIAPLGEDWDLELYDLFLARLSNDGTAMELNFCDQDVTIYANGQLQTLGQPKTPQALKDALYATPLRVSVAGDSIDAPELAWLWGVENLADPLNDPLPTKQDYTTNPHDFDQDNDGHPGVTVDVVSPQGQRYMVRRAKLTFGPSTLHVGNKWVTGKLTSKVEEIALGASSSLLETAAPLALKENETTYQFMCVGASYSCKSHIKDHRYWFKNAPR